MKIGMGKTGKGVKIPPVTHHFEGLYYEQDSDLIIECNKKSGYKNIRPTSSILHSF